MPEIKVRLLATELAEVNRDQNRRFEISTAVVNAAATADCIKKEVCFVIFDLLASPYVISFDSGEPHEDEVRVAVEVETYPGKNPREINNALQVIAVALSDVLKCNSKEILCSKASERPRLAWHEPVFVDEEDSDES